VTARTLFLMLLGGFTVTLAYAWAVLPERVPVHFGASGAADRVVGRERAVVEIGLVGYGTAALLAGAATLVHRLPMTLFNTPHKEYWSRPENEPRLRALAARDLWVIAAFTMGLFIVVELITVAVADDPEPRLGSGTLLVLALYLVGLTGYLVWSRRRYRPESDR
jgi:uncharacterized membrane protein